MGKRFQKRGIKRQKAYRVDELAETARVSTATVRVWIKAGMQRVDETRPTLIIGFQALDFLEGKLSKAKRPLALGEFYCLRCKVPRMPYGLMADYLPASESGGRLKALCGVCECPCNRNISATHLPDFAKVLSIVNRGSD